MNKETENAYNNGFYTGLNWPDAWTNHGKPGGPWIPSPGHNDKHRAAHAQAVAENKAWCEGWEAGQKEKVATGRNNPLIGTDENALYHAKK